MDNLAVADAVASALALALAAVVPAPIEIAARGGEVLVRGVPGELAIGVDAIVDQSGDRRENIETAALCVLENVQDAVIEALKRGWPGGGGSAGDLPLAEAHVRDGTLSCWYGRDGGVTLRLPPIAVQS